jgi:hypothetical protein
MEFLIYTHSPRVGLSKYLQRSNEMSTMLKEKETIYRNSNSNKGRCSGGCTKWKKYRKRSHASKLSVTIQIRV